MSKVCHAHCPGGGSVLGGALAVVAVAAIAAAVAQVVASTAQAVMVAGFAVLGASAVAAVAVVRHLNRPVPMMRPGAERAPERRVVRGIPSPLTIARSQPAAITAARSYVITDAAESRVAINREDASQS